MPASPTRPYVLPANLPPTPTLPERPGWLLWGPIAFYGDWEVEAGMWITIHHRKVPVARISSDSAAALVMRAVEKAASEAGDRRALARLEQELLEDGLPPRWLKGAVALVG